MVVNKAKAKSFFFWDLSMSTMTIIQEENIKNLLISPNVCKCLKYCDVKNYEAICKKCNLYEYLCLFNSWL